MRFCFTRLLLVVVLLTVVPSLLAQSHERQDVVAVTLSKESELTAKLVPVFEWILAAHFTPGERQELEQLVAEYSRSSNVSERQTLQNIADLQQKIDSIPPDRVDATRAAIQEQVLKEMRKQPDEPTAKLVLSVYRRSHGNAVTARASQPVVDRTSSSTPNELVGQWIARRGSGSMYQNPNTGSFSAPNATIDSYKFFADGNYEHGILMQNSLYNCTIRVFGRETGRALVNGNSLTITPSPGTVEYTDTCRPQMNSKKTTQMDGQTWRWQTDHDEQGVKLCVVDAKGASACYYKQ